MKFSELDKHWQKVFELGWKSFCEGNLPIAAIIVDDAGNILSEGRNHYVSSKRFPNCKVDHAETACIQQLDIVKHPDLQSYTLYTSMEPCPMCIGTIIMSNLKRVKVAAHDAWAGASDICMKNSYAQKKSVIVEFADDILANIQIALQGCVELKYNGTGSEVYKSFMEMYPVGAAAAYKLYTDKLAEELVKKQAPVSEAFDAAATIVETIHD
ncbi:MAG: nucleoside deaminase [Ruminiclostridium sp.]|nr:nucleoside deaminase [Ruminiclostridium sp.]